jgi:hypothetical protein
MKKLLLLVVLILGISTAQAQTPFESKLTQEIHDLKEIKDRSVMLNGEGHYVTIKTTESLQALMVLMEQLNLSNDTNILTHSVSGITSPNDILNWLNNYLPLAEQNVNHFIASPFYQIGMNEPLIKHLVITYNLGIVFSRAYN